MRIFRSHRRAWSPKTMSARTQAEVEALWQAWLGTADARGLLARPWDGPRLFLVMIRPDGRPSGTLHHIAWLALPFDAQEADRFAAYLVDVTEELRSVIEIALLYARPGGPQLTTADLAMCCELYQAARRHGLILSVIHVAGDEGITPVPLDALEAA